MELLLGHLVGDYFGQTHNMALHKKDKNLKGFLYCFVHCLIYTVAVCLFISRWDLLAVIGIFASHWFVDRYWWLTKIHTRLMGRPTVCSNSAVGTFVYIVCDNTIHLVLMWLILKI